MKRRDFITLLGGAAAWPFAARAQPAAAQQGERMRRLGVLMSLAADDPESPPRAKALQQGLRQFGWIEDQNIKVEYRWTAGDPDRAATFAKELVAWNPDVIIGVTSPV